MRARQECERARQEVSLLNRLLHDLVSGRMKDAYARQTRTDGWSVEATLYRATNPEGGLVLVVDRDAKGAVQNVHGQLFDAWRSHVRTLSFEHHEAEHRLADQLAAARQTLWDTVYSK